MFNSDTLLFVLVVVVTLSAGALLLVTRLTVPVPGVSRWVQAKLCGVGAIVLAAGHGVLPEFLVIVPANILLVLGFALLSSGFQQFLGQRDTLGVGLALSVLHGAIITYCTFVDPSPVGRIVSRMLVMGTLNLIVAWSLLRRTPEPGVVRVILGLFNLFYALVHFQQAYAYAHMPTDSYFQGGSSLVMAEVMGIFHVLLTIFSQLIMILEWLTADLRRQANVDPLTGAMNRRSFTLVADKSMARAERSGRPLSMLMFDLDHFKQVNDSHGHAFGDELLRRFAALALTELRAEDAFSRHGGEEFVALLTDTDPIRALAVAERLRRSFAEDDVVRTVGGTVSVGIARFVSGDCLDTLMQRADRALYRAKDSGRDRCILAEGGGAGIVMSERSGVVSSS